MKAELILIIFIGLTCKLYGSSECETLHGKPMIVSTEIDTISGQITFDMYLEVNDSLKSTNIFRYSKPGFLNITINSYPTSGNWYLPGDSIYFNVTIYHSNSWLPFFSQEFHIINEILIDSDTDIVDFHGYIYFTPWNTVEIWDNYDYYTIGRVWKQPGTFIDTNRIFVPKNNVRESNFNVEDSFGEEWMAEFDIWDTTGLGFFIKMQPLHPDTTEYLSLHYGDDSVYHNLNDSNMSISGPAPKYTGTITGRLVTPFINDIGDTVTMPLTGVFVKLKEKDFYGSQDFGNTHTDENGDFTIAYDKEQYFEGDDIELWLEFKSKNIDANLVVCRPRLDFMDISILASSESFPNRKDNPEVVGQNAGTVNFGNIHCEDHAFWVTNWAMNAYRYASVSSKFINHGKSLKIILNASASQYSLKVIKLNDFADDHEKTIYHEYGHHIMYALQGGGYMNVAGYPHKNDGSHGTNCSRISMHHWHHEEHSRMTFSEGFADAICMILDGAYWQQDDEYGWLRTQGGSFDQFNGFELRGTNTNRGVPKEINNGFKSEYYFACAIYDMWDGENKGLPIPTLKAMPREPNVHPFNDRRFDNSSGNWPVYDLVSLSFADIIKPLDIHDGENKLHNVNEYIEAIMFEVYGNDCEARRGVAKCLYHNRVVLNILDVEAEGEDWNTMITSDEIYEFVTDNDLGKSIGCISIPDNIFYKREFIEDTSKKVFNLNHLSEEISNTSISDNLRLGYNFILPSDQSVFNFNTTYSNRNLSMNTCGDVTWSINNNKFNLGDGTNTSILKFNDGGKLILDGMSVLNINDNSKVTIEAGAILEFHPGAQIILNGPNAVLEIKGQIQIMNGATFSVSGGTSGLGYIKFYRDKNSGLPPLINSPTDDGSVQLIGSGSNNKLIEIDGTEGLFIDKIIIDNKLNYIVDFSIKQAKVVLGDKSRIEPIVSGKVLFEEVDINQLYNGYKHDGVLINGVQNEFHKVRINGGNYGFTNNGLILGGEKLYLRAVQITDCAVGIMTYSSGITYHGGFVKGYSIAGWKSVGANVPSDVTGVMFNNDQNNSEVYGVLLDGVNAAGDVTFTGSTFQNNLSGIQFWSVPVRLKSCNYFANNYIGAQMEAWSKLDMSNNSYTTFDGNTTHFVSRYNGVLHMYGGRNGFLQSGNSTVFFASLEPGAQSPSVLINSPNYNAYDNFFQMSLIQAPVFGNNFWLDERKIRLLNLNTNSTYPSNNPGIWNTAQATACGTPDYETLEFNGTGGGVGQFLVGKYSTLNAITIPNGLEYGNNLISVSKGLLDSLYLSTSPNYAQTTCKLGHLARYTYSNNSQTMKDFKIEMLDNALKSYALGVSKNKILTRKDTMVYASNCLINTIDTLLIDANNDSLPWKNFKFGLSTMKSEVLRIAKHRAEAVSHLQSLLTTYTDSLEQVYITKWKCVNEAEIALIDSQVSRDSLYIVYPCYGSAIEFNAPMPYSLDVNKNNSKLDNLENTISLFPNPSKDYLEIKLNNNQPIKKATIYDLRGVEILKIDNLTDASELNINIENISSGTYIIQVLTDDFVYNKRLVISK